MYKMIQNNFKIEKCEKRYSVKRCLFVLLQNFGKEKHEYSLVNGPENKFSRFQVL